MPTLLLSKFLEKVIFQQALGSFRLQLIQRPHDRTILVALDISNAFDADKHGTNKPNQPINTVLSPAKMGYQLSLCLTQEIIPGTLTLQVLSHTTGNYSREHKIRLPGLAAHH